MPDLRNNVVGYVDTGGAIVYVNPTSHMPGVTFGQGEARGEIRFGVWGGDPNAWAASAAPGGVVSVTRSAVVALGGAIASLLAGTPGPIASGVFSVNTGTLGGRATVAITIAGSTFHLDRPSGYAQRCAAEMAELPTTTLLTLGVSVPWADATVFYAVPTGLTMTISSARWDDPTNGRASREAWARDQQSTPNPSTPKPNVLDLGDATIGISSDAAGLTAKGSILGGPGGDGDQAVAAGGTKGSQLALGPVVVGAGKVLRLDRITGTPVAAPGFTFLRLEATFT